MTEYFILLPGDKKSELTEANLLGTVSLYSTFWPAEGLNVLSNISKRQPELLNEIKIINSKSTELSIEQFMDMLDTLKIKTK